MGKIGIAGFGFVGQALYLSIKDKENVVIFNKKPGYNTIGELMQSDIIFVCLPTPMLDEGKQDTGSIGQLMVALAAKGYTGVVAIKSTVLYSTVQPWIGPLNIVVNPEFLNQNTAASDFKQQKLIILGGTANHCSIVIDYYRKCFDIDGHEYIVVPHVEACNFKYLHNIYHAYQVLFWNYVYELTGNHRKYALMYEKLTGIKPLLSQVCADGKMGYGGACFPKDIHAMQYDSPHILTEYMCEFNKLLRNPKK